MSAPGCEWHCRDRKLKWPGAVCIMGILNVTPDSFSDGGRYESTEKALAQARRMIAEGAGIIDIGGESTRPGAVSVPVDEELRRVIPVIRELAAEQEILLSVDTAKAAVAQAAIAAGAHIINDVTAMTGDPAMADVVRDTGAGVVLMHMQGTPRDMQSAPHYGDVVGEVYRYLHERLDAVCAAGIRRECCAIDPGIGFGKNAGHNIELLKGLSRFAQALRPVVLGASRKSIIGHLTGRQATGERLAGSLAVAAMAVQQGVQIIRVHDVRASIDAVRVAEALK